MRDYELVWIIGGDSSDDEIDASLTAVSELIESGGGKIAVREPWGRRSLAYPIKKNTEGFYSLARFAMEPAAAAEMEQAVYAEQQIIRHILVRVDGDVEQTAPANIDSAPVDRARRRPGPRR